MKGHYKSLKLGRYCEFATIKNKMDAIIPNKLGKYKRGHNVKFPRDIFIV